VLIATLESVSCSVPGEAAAQRPERPAPPPLTAAVLPPAFENDDLAPRDVVPSAPRWLTCLTTAYGLDLERAKTRNCLPLHSGVCLAFGDGKSKDPEKLLNAPDLADMFVAPYPRGPAAVINGPNGDPGRARSVALLFDLYGAEVSRRDLVSVMIAGRAFLVHPRVAPALRRVAETVRNLIRERPELKRFFGDRVGSFNHRNIAGTGRLSMHALGAAIDLDSRFAAYHLWDAPSPHWHNQIPDAIVAAFEAEGFIWGGRWYHYDTMHFEYRPELLDARCRP
jgi:hypothetical protein